MGASGSEDATASAVAPSTRAQFRTVIALTMLLIASLGAAVAGWAAIKQQSADALEHRLTQAQMMELSDRLRLTDQSRSAKALAERLNRHLEEAKAFRALALQEAADNRAQAQLHELHAQEAMLLANVVRPFVEFLPNIIAPDNSLDERRIGLVAVGSLQQRGFEASWVEGASGVDTPRIQFQEKERIEGFDAQVLWLAAIVVALVASLLLLTFADMSGQRHVLGGLCYGLALISGAGAIAAAVAVDQELMPIIGAVTAGFVLLIGLAAVAGWLKAAQGSDDLLQPQGIDAQGFAGSQLQIQEAGRGFTRLLVASIALAALASSIIGFWYSASSMRGGDAAQDAYQHQLEVVKRAGRSSTAALGTFEAIVDLHERRVRCQAARNQVQLARDGKIQLSAKVAAFNEQRQCGPLEDMAGAPESKTLMELDQRFGPYADARFPLRLYQEATGTAPETSAEQALALWDGYGELMAYWNAKTTAFLASLTIAAIALYLFGQALAMAQLRVTRAMAASGILMMLAAVVWSAAVWLRPPPSGASAAVAPCPLPREAEKNISIWQPETWMRVAAHNYALGSHKLWAADSEADFASAITSLECAVGARPNFALAHHELAGAKSLIQSAHKGQFYYSLPTKDRLDEIERNTRMAVDIQRRLGMIPNSYALNAHAVALWGIGVRDGKVDSIHSALAIVERAIALSETLEADRLKVSADQARNLYPWLSVLPLLYLNQSLFLIATDRIDAARGAAQKGLALGVHRDWNLSGTMITATGLLDVNCERLHPADRCGPIRAALLAYKRALMLGSWDPAPTAAPATHAVMAATSSNLMMAARIANFEPSKDRLDVVWSVLDPQWRVRDALTAIMPNIAPAELRVVQDRGLTFQRGMLQNSAFRRCLSPGRYTAEIYVNGALANTATAERPGPVLAAARLDELNLAFCHPSTWRAWAAGDGMHGATEPVAGFVNERGKPAAFLFSYMLPSPVGTEAAELASYATDRALQYLASHDIVRGMPADLRARLQTCDKAASGGIVRTVARGNGGHMHVILVLPDALEGVSTCDVLNSAIIMHGPPA